MSGWDYSRNGYYFITPVILNMKCLPGKIENDKMMRSDFGQIAFDEWHKSFEINQELFLDDNKMPVPKFNRNNRLWQTNYYDHFIRDKDEYRRIKYYIRNNPKKWKQDKFRS